MLRPDDLQFVLRRAGSGHACGAGQNDGDGLVVLRPHRRPLGGQPSSPSRRFPAPPSISASACRRPATPSRATGFCTRCRWIRRTRPSSGTTQVRRVARRLLHVSMNVFNRRARPSSACAVRLDRAAMIAGGGHASRVGITVRPQPRIPVQPVAADLDGSNLPPAGAPDSCREEWPGTGRSRPRST